jgi:hypothetical protein
MKILLISVLLAFTAVAHAADSTPVNPHGSSPHRSAMSAVDLGDIKVSKAVGQNAYTVAEIIDQAASLKDKPVVVRGKVVKFSPEIMNKNWIHLRDGTGSTANKSNDLVITSKDQAKVGAVVVVKGIVRTSKDFGHGYSYDVLIEDATLSP